jgi:hypothetical protein
MILRAQYRLIDAELAAPSVATGEEELKTRLTNAEP